MANIQYGDPQFYDAVPADLSGQGMTYVLKPQYAPFVSTGLSDFGPGSSNVSNFDFTGWYSQPNNSYINTLWASDPLLKQLSAVDPTLRQRFNPAQYTGGDYLWGMEHGGAAADITHWPMPGLYEGLAQAAPNQIETIRAAFNKAQEYKQEQERDKGFWDKAGSIMETVMPIAMMAGLGYMGLGATGFLGGAAEGAGAGAAGAFDMGGLAGTGIPEAWGIGDAAAGWGVTQGASGMDVWDLMGNLDAYGLGGAAESASPYSGLFSRYGLGIPGNDAAVGGLLESYGSLGLPAAGSAGTSWLDYLRQGSSVLRNVLGGSGSGGIDPLLGAGIGALLGGLGGSKQAGTTTTTVEPWAAQQPYLMAGFGSALNTLGTTPQSSVLGPAEQGLLATIRGDYLNANPWLDATYQKAANQVLPGIEGYFSRAGRTGSYSGADALSNAASKLATDIYGGNYTRERSLQNQGILGAPAFANNITAARFAPTLNYMQAIGGNRGTSTSVPYYENQLGSILSGAATGLGMSRYF